MTGKTHIAGGILAGLCTSALMHKAGNTVAGISQMAGIVSIATVGGLAPDIDLQTSKAGRALKPASFFVQHIFGHRTLFHAPILYILLFLMGYLTFPMYADALVAFTFGALSHVILDACNSRGVPLLYPLSRKVSFAGIKTGGMSEIILSTALYFCIPLCAAYMVANKIILV